MPSAARSKGQSEASSESSGYSLLEFAVVLPLLLVLTLGALDIGSILHSYSAAREGVQSALRCVFPSDGLCVESSGQNLEPLFDVSRVTVRPRYFSELYNYQGSAEWLSTPVQRFNANAEVLDQVHFSIEGQAPSSVATLIRFPAMATLNYVVRTAYLPHVIGSDYHPRFVMDDGVTPYPAALRARLSGSKAPTQIGGANRSVTARSIGETSFTLNSPAREVTASECFLPQTATTNPDFAKICQNDFPWSADQEAANSLKIPAPTSAQELSQFTYIMLHITGQVDSNTTEPDAVGKVRLFLEQGGERRNLGARLISRNSEGDFLVRGAPKSYLGGDLSSYQEYQLHQAIQVRYNVPFSLKFSIESVNGKEVGWTGGRIAIYMPQYVPGTLEAKCALPLSKSEAKTSSSCPLDLSNQGSSVTSITSSSQPLLQVEQPIRSGESLALGCVQSESDTQARLNDLIIANQLNFKFEDYLIEPSGNNTCQISLTDQSSQCPEAGMAFAGGTPNYGLAIRPGEDSLIRDSAEAEKICPPQSALTRNGGNISISNVRWSTHQARVTVPDHFDWTPPDCQHQSPTAQDLPSEWLRFQLLDLISVDGPSARAPVASVGLELASALENDPLYSCGLFLKDTRNFPDSSSIPSLFSGPQPDLGCTWKDLVRSEALRLGLSASANFRASRSRAAGTIEIPNRPSDECTSYRVAADGISSLVRIGRYPKSQIPNECSANIGNCRLDPVISTDVPLQNGNSLDFDKAKQFAFEAISAALPAVRRECQGDFCTQIELEQNGDLVRARGSIETPLFVLGGRRIHVGFADKKLLESSIAHR